MWVCSWAHCRASAGRVCASPSPRRLGHRAGSGQSLDADVLFQSCCCGQFSSLAPHMHVAWSVPKKEAHGGSRGDRSEPTDPVGEGRHTDETGLSMGGASLSPSFSLLVSFARVVWCWAHTCPSLSSRFSHRLHFLGAVSMSSSRRPNCGGNTAGSTLTEPHSP